jgi:hypothetical protein
MTITPYESEMMNEDVTYWAPISGDGFGGVSFAAPIVIKCRWQVDNKMRRDSQGEEFYCDAIVYPNHAVRTQGFLVKGVSSAATPKSVEGASEIRLVKLSPSLDDDVTLIKAFV